MGIPQASSQPPTGHVRRAKTSRRNPAVSLGLPCSQISFVEGRRGIRMRERRVQIVQLGFGPGQPSLLMQAASPEPSPSILSATVLLCFCGGPISRQCTEEKSRLGRNNACPHISRDPLHGVAFRSIYHLVGTPPRQYSQRVPVPRRRLRVAP
jgi:hypothetical protein